jgi:tRNA pseudouridine55 synthase
MITKAEIGKFDADFLIGESILIDKEKGPTSFDVISKIRKVTGVKKVGHAGTLDPAATGLLIICTGKKTKDIHLFQDLGKTYSGIISLGKSTPSMDAETDFVDEIDCGKITGDEVESVKQKFIGTIFQTPPMYSALKHKGKALYKYARKGIEIERLPREVNITKFEIIKFENPDIHFEIECSKGTYIRVIADDIGKMLNVGGYLKKLRRTKIGNYSVNDALTINEFADNFTAELVQ